MNFSSLSASDKRMLIAAIVVVVGFIISIIDRWGFGGIIGGLAGVAAVGVILQPQLAPAMKLPAPKATLMLVFGGVAALGFLVSALQYIGFVFDLRLYTLLFDAGLVAAIVLAYLAWVNYRESQGAAPAAPSTQAAPPAPSEPPPPPPPAAEG